MRSLRLQFGAVAALLAGALAGAAAAKPPPAPPPRLLQALQSCRAQSADAARLACYDRAADELQAAQAKGDVVVVDREQVRAVRRQAFGLALPSLSLLPHERGDTPDRVVLTLDHAGQIGDGRWLMVSTEDAAWLQSEPQDLFNTPHKGSRLEITRGLMNGFFCKLDGQSSFRCKRQT